MEFVTEAPLPGASPDVWEDWIGRWAFSVVVVEFLHKKGEPGDHGPIPLS